MGKRQKNQALKKSSTYSIRVFAIAFLLPGLLACSEAKIKTTFSKLFEKGGYQQEPYLRLEVQGTWVQNSSKALLTNSYCHPAQFKIFQNSQAYNYTGSAALEISWSNPAWGALYSDAYCTTQVTTASIATAASSSGQLYVKAITNNLDQSFAVTSNDASLVIDGSSLVFDVKNPKLKAYLPSKVVFGSGICYWGRVERQLATGWSFSQMTSMSVNMQSDAAWNIGDGSCGSNTLSSYISTSMSSGFFQYNPMSAGPHNLVFSAPGYDSHTLTIETGLGQNLVDHLSVVPMSTAIVGECIPLSVRLMNYNDAAVALNYSAEIRVSPTQVSDGILYNSPNCMGAMSSSIYFSTGQSEVMIGYLPLKSMVHNLKFVHPFYKFADGGQVYPITASSNLSGIYVTADVPTFNGKKVVGSHEFGSTQLIPIHFPSGSSLTCSFDYGMSYVDCDTLVDANYNFRWSVADASINKEFYFRVVNIYGQRDFRFNPMQIYGNNFIIVECDYTVSANINLDQLESQFSSTSRICVNSGIQISRPSAAMQANLAGANLMLIGHTDGTSSIDSGGFAGASPTVDFSANIDGNLIFANLNFLNNGVDTRLVKFQNSAYSAVYTNINFVENIFTAVNGVALDVATSDPDMYFYLSGNQYSLVPNAAISSGAVVFAGQQLGSFADTITNLTYPADMTGSVGYKLTNLNVPYQNFNISYLEWSGGNSSLGVSTSGTSLYPINYLNLRNSSFKSYNAITTIRTKPLLLKDTNFYLSENLIGDQGSQVSDGTHYLLKFGNDYMNSTVATITNNVFRHGTNGGGLLQMSSGASYPTIQEFTNNQFVSIASPGLDISSKRPLDNFYASGMTHFSTYYGSNLGNNLFCSSSSYVWDYLLVSSMNSGNWDYNNANSKCKKSNNVSFNGLCKSLCDP